MNEKGQMKKGKKKARFKNSFENGQMKKSLKKKG